MPKTVISQVATDNSIARDLSDDAGLAQMIDFIIEADRLKCIERRTYVEDAHGDYRRENAAEHSWHAVLTAMLLMGTAAEPVDLLKVLKMLVIHDLVEIDAGDTFIHDEEAKQTQHEREAKAAARLFGMLPTSYGEEFSALWQEFEECTSPEARYARSIDHILPQILHLQTEGKTWTESDICVRRTRAITDFITRLNPPLGKVSETIVTRATACGYLKA